MFSKIKKYVIGSGIVLGVLGWIYKICRDNIRYEAARLNLKKEAKKLEEKAEKNIVRKNQITSEIEKIDKEIINKKIEIDKINKKARERIDVSNLSEDEKLKLFNKLVK